MKLCNMCATTFIMFPALATGAVQVTHDRFKAETEYATESPPPQYGVMSLHADAAVKDDASGQVRISLWFMGIHETWRYLQCHDVSWLVDGEPFALPSAKHTGRVLQGSVAEIVNIAPLTADQLDTLAHAKTVEYRLCNDEGAMTPDLQADLAEMADKLHALP